MNNMKNTYIEFVRKTKGKKRGLGINGRIVLKSKISRVWDVESI